MESTHNQADISGVEQINRRRNKQFVDRIFSMLQDNGFYTPHQGCTMKATDSQLTYDGRLTFDTFLSTSATHWVCAKPPNKRQFLAALYEYRFEETWQNFQYEHDDEPITDNWLANLIERASEPCTHVDQWHQNGTIQMRAMSNCHSNVPVFDLNSTELLELTTAPRVSSDCCDVIGEVMKEKILRDRIGTGSAYEVVRAHQHDASNVMQVVLAQVTQQWEANVKLELHQLVSIQSQPQDMEVRQAVPSMEVILDQMQQQRIHLETAPGMRLFAPDKRHQK